MAKKTSKPAPPAALEKVQGLVATQPRSAIDMVVAALARGLPRRDSKAFVDLLSEAIVVERQLDIHPDARFTIDTLFGKRVSKSDRRFIAATLLRALAADRNCIPEDVLRRHVQRLFDDELSDQLYRRLEIDKADTTERLLELFGLASTAEREFDSVIAEYQTLDSVRGFQQRFMRATQDAAFNAVIRPFLPEDLLGTQFKAFAGALAAASDLSGTDGFARFKAAERAAAEYVEVAETYDSEYSKRYLVRLGREAKKLLNEAFSESVLCKPASLTIAPSAKKYPLHRPDSELQLALFITNGADGPASDVTLSFDNTGPVLPVETEYAVGDVPANGKQLTIFALIADASESATLSYVLEWQNADGSSGDLIDEITLKAQARDVNWEAFARLGNAYPNRAVTDDKRLAGRQSLMRSLRALATGPEVGSARISGQKRVGKSSVVRSLQSSLTRDAPLIVAYVDVNRLGVGDDAGRAIAALLRTISRELVKASPTLDDVPVPDYEQGLEEFAPFLETIREREPTRSVLVLLDEFDELPNEAFDRGGPGDALFRALKSFSSDGECGFFLVGGERLELALSRQNDRLNAFREFRVDYLGQDEFADFCELVRKPVEGFVEYDTAALRLLHRLTGGHPFYTFLVCRAVVATAQSNRDSHVTEREVTDAYATALQEAPASAFGHVWFDHIFDDHETEAVIADRRIRVLLAWSTCLRRCIPATDEGVTAAATDYELDSAATREELRSFVNRKLLRLENERYVATSEFFQDWLREWGSEKIRAEQPGLDSLKRFAVKEESERIRSKELTELTASWPPYMAKTVGAEEVRAWLEQFGDTSRQRIGLRLLEHLRFYSTRQVKELFRDIHRKARAGTIDDVDARSRGRKRRDFAVIYIEPDGKSGSTVANQYADANDIVRDCVTNVERLPRLMAKFDIQRVVIVDDFIGSGSSAGKRLREHQEILRQAANRTGREIMLVVICGFENGIVAVERASSRVGLNVLVAPCEELGESDSCFSEASAVFRESDERLTAERVVEELGRDIGSKEPLGTGNGQALIVFEHNTPNNSLPILWKHGSALSWTALFPRRTTS